MSNLKKNNLYNKRVVCLGMYPTKRLANLAVSIAMEIIAVYKIKNNDKIATAIMQEIKEYRESISIPPVSRYGAIPSKKMLHKNHPKEQYKYVFPTKRHYFE